MATFQTIVKDDAGNIVDDVTITMPPGILGTIENAFDALYGGRIMDIENPDFDNEQEISEENPRMIKRELTKIRHWLVCLRKHTEDVVSGFVVKQADQAKVTALNEAQNLINSITITENL